MARECLHEANDGRDFDNGEDELSFTVGSDAEEVDADDDGEEDDYEYRFTELVVPVSDSKGSGDDLQRENDEPLQAVANRVSQQPDASLVNTQRQ